MNTADLLAIGFSQQQISEMHDANKHVKALYRGGALDAWLKHGPGLLLIREKAMRAAKTNNPKNRECQEFQRKFLKELMPEWLHADGKMRDEVGHLIFLAEPEHRDILDEYRHGLSKANLANLALPKSARGAVDRILKARKIEAELKALRVKPDDNAIGEQMQAERNEEPTATEKQLRAAFMTKFVSQQAALFVEWDTSRARDLAKSIMSEIQARNIELKEQQRREKAA